MDEVYIGGGVGSRRRAIPSTSRQTAVCVFMQYYTETATVNLVGRDGQQQQPDTPSSLTPQAAPLVPISGP